MQSSYPVGKMQEEEESFGVDEHDLEQVLKDQEQYCKVSMLSRYVLCAASSR